MPVDSSLFDKILSVDLGLIFIILINTLWYWIKSIVHSKGYPVNLFWGHFRDLKFMHEIIKKEDSLIKQKLFKSILYGLYFIIILIVGIINGI